MRLTKKRFPHFITATCLALVVSLVCGILLADRASAKSDKSKPNKVSSDLRGQNSGGDQVDVIIQLNDKPSGRLNALLNENGVHAGGGRTTRGFGGPAGPDEF